MKLKYYLRGVGLGIIFATLVMTVSSVYHNNNLSKEEIIEEAKKLGMVMPDETSGQLWSEDTSSTEETIESNVTEDVLGTEADTQIAQNSEQESQEENESQEESELPADSELSEESESPEDGDNPSDSEHPTDSESPSDVEDDAQDGIITLVITDLDGARHVGEKLFAAGLVEDGEDFRWYLADKGYAKKIRSGTFEIPVGSSYDEIIDIIIKK